MPSIKWTMVSSLTCVICGSLTYSPWKEPPHTKATAQDRRFQTKTVLTTVKASLCMLNIRMRDETEMMAMIIIGIPRHSTSIHCTLATTQVTLWTPMATSVIWSADMLWMKDRSCLEKGSSVRGA